MVSSFDENVFQTKEGDCVSTGWQLGVGRWRMSVVKFSEGGVHEKGLEGVYGQRQYIIRGALRRH